MSTINYLRVCESQKKEISTTRSQFLDAQQMFFPKRKDPDVVAAEKRLARSEYKSNMCSTCFTLKSSSGVCSC